MPLEKVDSFDLLSDEIKDITIDFLQNRFGDTQFEINFHQALIYSTDSLIIKNLELLKKRNIHLNTIPYYDMHFSLSDPNLGISQYWLNIRLDKFGQVFYCNFPNFFGDKSGKSGQTDHLIPE